MFQQTAKSIKLFLVDVPASVAGGTMPLLAYAAATGFPITINCGGMPLLMMSSTAEPAAHDAPFHAVFYYY